MFFPKKKQILQDLAEQCTEQTPQVWWCLMHIFAKSIKINSLDLKWLFSKQRPEHSTKALVGIIGSLITRLQQMLVGQVLVYHWLKGAFANRMNQLQLGKTNAIPWNYMKLKHIKTNLCMLRDFFCATRQTARLGVFHWLHQQAMAWLARLMTSFETIPTIQIRVEA